MTHHRPPAGPPAQGQPGASANLEFLTVRQLRERVQAQGPRKWLIRRVIVQGDYGVHGAEPKAGKTMNTADLAVAVASGTPWLGSLPVDNPGPVLMFVGEGGQGNILRRLDAAAVERGLPNADDLPIIVCTRAPHLNDQGHMWQFENEIETVRPVLVTLDPLYLSIGDAIADAHGTSLKRETMSRYLNSLKAQGIVQSVEVRSPGTRFPTKMWARVTPCDVTGDPSHGDSRVTPCDLPYTVTGSRHRNDITRDTDPPTSHGKSGPEEVAS